MSQATTPPVLPDGRGYFGDFGGRFVPETLMQGLYDLEQAYRDLCADTDFKSAFDDLLRHYVGRPTPLYFAERLTRHCGGARMYLKREDLAHTGAHKINNAIGQVLLAQRMGKRRIVAETGAGQHGVATATACALLDIECVVYMGSVDVERQHMNVLRMNLLGADVRPVDAGSKTLKDAINEAIRDWVTNVDTTCYVIGSVVGPHPYPMMVRDFQSVIGREAREQFIDASRGLEHFPFSHAGSTTLRDTSNGEKPRGLNPAARNTETGNALAPSETPLPDAIVACVGGGSNAMGIFHAFLEDDVPLIGVEAAGLGCDTGRHCATLGAGRVGVLHGARSYLLQDDDGQVMPTHSISAGLDYPGVGPELAHLKQTGRMTCANVTDDEALAAFKLLSRTEGIIPALESAHAVAHATRLAAEMPNDRVILINLSGRGDKDLAIVERAEQQA